MRERKGKGRTWRIARKEYTHGSERRKAGREGWNLMKWEMKGVGRWINVSKLNPCPSHA
jgi:hypothetical protein